MKKDELIILKHEDVGIHQLKDLTKEELLECITFTFMRDSSAKFWFERYVLTIADIRRKKQLKDDEAKGDKWIALEKEYEELLRPYAGKPWSEVPTDVIQKAAEVSKAARKAQKEYFETFDTKPVR